MPVTAMARAARRTARRVRTRTPEIGGLGLCNEVRRGRLRRRRTVTAGLAAQRPAGGGRFAMQLPPWRRTLQRPDPRNSDDFSGAVGPTFVGRARRTAVVG